MANFNLEDYAPVGDRIALFVQDFPEGSIRTFMVRRDGPEVVFEARCYRTPGEAERGVYTSGWAQEIEGKTPVNKTSFIENAETSAIGRALANMGYTTNANRASRSEMIKVARMKEEHEALLQYIRTVGSKVPDAADIEIAGVTHNLKEYVRKNWNTIKEQYRVARAVVDAIEAVTDAPFTQEASA